MPYVKPPLSGGCRLALMGLAAARRQRLVVIARIDNMEAQWVKAAREAGASWRDIGEVLGTSGQAAHERYRAR